jgi:hypothetical protein
VQIPLMCFLFLMLLFFFLELPFFFTFYTLSLPKLFYHFFKSS